MNKEDLINEIRECRFGVNESITDIDELWVWINQNYISKEQILNLECLKEEVTKKKRHFNLLKDMEQLEKAVRNQLRKEIKEQINKL